MTTSLTNQSETQRGTPTWLNAVIVSLVLLVGIWAAWYFAFREAPPTDVVKEEVVDAGGGRRQWVPPSSRPYAAGNNPRWQGGPGGGGPGGGGGRGNMGAPNRNAVVAPNPDEPIRRTNSGAIRARYKDVLLSASYSQAKGVADVDLNYSFDLIEKWVSAKEIELHLLAWRASNIPNAGQKIALTDEQKKQLLALQHHMTVTPAELARVREMLTAWVAAENNAAARDKATATILATMTEIGKLHEAETKGLFQKRIAAIPSILSADQIEQLRQLQNAGNQPAPTPAPAPKATPAP
ncbi:MAG: hypothetical protein ACHRHE_17500 [Tepidisphaerales bacterium]